MFGIRRLNFCETLYVSVCTRDKVKVTRFDVQGLSHQLTGMGIEVEVEVHFVDIFRHLWYIFIKQI